jgi:trimeric autotransporter adhesin
MRRAGAPRGRCAVSACPESARLVAASAGEDVAALAHAAGCAACRRAMRDHLVLRELASELPAPRLDRARLGGMTAELLARADALVLAEPGPVTERVRARGTDASPVATRSARRTLPPRIVGGAALAAVVLAAAAVLIVLLRPAAPTRDLPIASSEPPDSSPSHVVTFDTAPPPPTRPRASLTAEIGARYERRADPSVDRIALRDGALTIETVSVPVILSGDNASVRSSSARVSARAAGGVLRQVQVFAGSVEIETNSTTVIISAGETWTYDDPADPATDPAAATADPAAAAAATATTATAAAAAAAAATAAATGSAAAAAAAADSDSAAAAAATATATAAASASARVTAFRRGWTALRANDFSAAAALFDLAVDDPGVGEDATYWAAIAHGRAGDTSLARAGLERFLARFPSSSRAGEAHLALARLLDATDPVAARAHREEAAKDPDPRVRSAAEAALGASSSP